MTQMGGENPLTFIITLKNSQVPHRSTAPRSETTPVQNRDQKKDFRTQTRLLIEHDVVVTKKKKIPITAVSTKPLGDIVQVLHHVRKIVDTTKEKHGGAPSGVCTTATTISIATVSPPLPLTFYTRM